MVEDLKKQYEILGLPEFADKEEVEKRYSLLLRRERSRQKLEAPDEASSQENGLDFEQVTAAYKQILAYEDQKFTEAFNEQEYGKYKKLSGQAQKVDHFWRYYKYHTIGAIAAVALLIYGIISFIDHQEEKKRLASLPPVDVSVMFMGTFGMKENDDKFDRINDALLEAFPDWSRFDSNIIFVPKDDMNQMAYLQKATVILATEIDDLYVMDEAMLHWIGQQGAFLDLGEEPMLAPLLTEQNSKKFAIQEDPTERIYAVDLGQTEFVNDVPVLGQNFYVGIRINAKNPEKAKQFLKHYLEKAAQ
ncbi:J domain-containing protein [Paenibacillus sp. GXUN7292]|uniref:J domain-containing protein n=1 Tax=Paenibacillus sp. GXUN7292 TaxID=3422499 RepID=UPI00336EA900